MTRVRFAPSPTGALHIGGVRTALYNYLFAKKQGGTFILRVEDTDQKRFVPAAEAYILESLKWLGIEPTEGQSFGGDFGPYKQSERKEMYTKAAYNLLENGKAYIAFDTPEELDVLRKAEPHFTYNHIVRKGLTNSLTLSADEVAALKADGQPFVIRLLVEPNETIAFKDRVRGNVQFNSSELDDKVLLKADGMPTYHLANIVDDHAMQITHVIRGEEWLPSTAHHVLLYRAFGWGDTIPEFAHLPLILKPQGKGKLSKRDGAKFGMPVFPLSWKADDPKDSFEGFREAGFLPEAVLNFLTLLGWSGSTDQEMFTIDETVAQFDVDKIQKAGARFNFDKAKWFNQQYILKKSAAELLPYVRPYADAKGISMSDDDMMQRIDLMKERVVFLGDFIHGASYLYGDVESYDQKTIDKRWNEDRGGKFKKLVAHLADFDYNTDWESMEAAVKGFMSENEIGPGDVFPFLRLSLAGMTKGPGIFQMMLCLGKAESDKRFQAFLNYVA